MTDFQVGDRVSVEGVVTQGLDTGAYVKIDYPQPIHHFFPTDALTLVERPRRRATAVLFLHGRLHFHYPDGERAPANSGAPSCLVAYGESDAIRLRSSTLAGTFCYLSDRA